MINSKFFFLIILFCINTSFSYAIDGCNGCHDEKWQSTPAHIWIETEHHFDIVACPDCHRWKDGDDLPPVLPSKKALQRDCGKCHQTPENLPVLMNMQQYQTDN